MAPSARVPCGRSRTASARVLRQLIVNARSLSKVAFTLLASFRGLAVSPRASFERLTLYHSRVIKQAVIFRVVFRLRPDLRCIECHRGRPLPFFAGTFLLVPSRTANCLQGLVALSWTEIVRYVRIRFHLRPVFLERVSESPGHRPLRTYPSIQAALSDSHIADFCPRGADFREEGVPRSKARAARPSAGPRVPPPRRLARGREPPSCYWLARAG